MVLHIRLNRSVENRERDAPVVNRFLTNTMLCFGLFVGWHYSCGSKYDSGFWRYARDHAWPQHRKAADPEVVGCAALRKFDEMIELMNQSVIDKSDWNRALRVLPSHQLLPDVSGSRLLAPVVEHFRRSSPAITPARTSVFFEAMPFQHSAVLERMRHTGTIYKIVMISES